VIDDATPVLVGVSQATLRDVDPREAPSPPQWLETTARAAIADAGASASALAELDTIALAPPIGWRSANPVRALGQRLGARPARELLLAVGGEMPLTFVDHVAGEIAAGRARSALVTGVHNLRTLRRARKQGVELDWPDEAEGVPELFGQNKPGTSDTEIRHGLDRPSHLYPLFETALRARRGLDPETHRLRVGQLMSAFTRVAAANPHAWFPTVRSADEITRPGDVNRMVAYPYTKYMNAVMETDQVVALWMLSAGAARAYGIPESHWIHYRGGATAHERAWFTSERPDLGQCPALEQAVTGALGRAALPLDRVDAFDFYSCFPVAVEMACEMLGLAEDDPRGLTVTGGLPYGGGPGNDYTLHSLASMVARLRERPGIGLVTGNGWYLTKHSACVISSEPGDGALPRPMAPPKSGPEPLPVRERADGAAEVAAYTVIYDRDGAPVRGVVVGRLEGGEAFVANTPDDAAVLTELTEREQVGRRGRVRNADGCNRIELL
jgi:acetyl-CoA C-acetyltransferase